ncbi:hypothetical protein P375_05810 [Gallibacterium genomosp. 2]|uniref:Uncharacterized protein n=1 Tax=Gallibacterium genomosp. 2 TaxID=155517 RepID=A0A0A2Y4B1_9PAST|nr:MULTISPECIES: hypothetical protein [Gallibacterium]KGQ32309.1 hypothetical protein P375_05810 [Gallibacterium genomosp. 2]KGQ36722.1 hypothetical protein JP30_11655 [Gallibacterium anatis IPDH697-78]
MSENFGYKLGKFIKNNFSSSTQKVVSAGVDSLEKRLNKPVKSQSRERALITASSYDDNRTYAKAFDIDASYTYYGKNNE